MAASRPEPRSTRFPTPGSARSAARARPTSSPTTASSTAPPTTVAIVGLGTVGRWLLGALGITRDDLARRYGIALQVAGVGSRSRGFTRGAGALDPEAVLATLDEGRPLADLDGADHRDDLHEGVGATEATIVVDVSASPPGDAQSAIALMREALARGSAVVTSNKWPVALSGRELADLAGSAGLPFRAESTVMSGTPVLGPLTEGLAGAMPTALRGVLNATANFILCEVESGRGYDEALADAQRRGLAESDPSADVDGHDATAKLMILAALVFGRPLAVQDVERAGISTIDAEAVAAARADGLRTRELATLAFDGESLRGRLEPVTLPAEDPLAAIEGTDNGVVCEAQPIGRVMITGPGAGPRLAGQGVFSDLINAARALAADGRRAG